MIVARANTILLDIEGTTTPIEFVYDVLFPYARLRMRDYIRNHIDTIQQELKQLVSEHSEDSLVGLLPPPLYNSSREEIIESITAYVHWLMDIDRKSQPLKSLQGKIWEHGYENGEIKSQVFEDVPIEFDKWHKQKIQICIYSSGSVLAQKLLFKYTEAGDLTPFISEYFDTTIGPKLKTESYTVIAHKLKLAPAEITFVSDSPKELEAAHRAGMQVVHSIRPGNKEWKCNYSAITSLDQLTP